jgi:hypothetical protein
MVATVARVRIPRSTPARVVGRAAVRGVVGVRSAYPTEMNSRPHRCDSVMLRIRARPPTTWRCTRRVFSIDRSLPITGTVMVRRSASRRIAPVLNRTRPGSRRADVNRGKPTRRPARVPVLLACQLSNARARSASPLEYASLEFSAHHGATSSLARFHAQRSDAKSQPTDTCCGSARRAARSVFTCAKPQLNALRRAPKCERTSRARSGSVGHSTSNFAAVTTQPVGTGSPGLPVAA